MVMERNLLLYSGSKVIWSQILYQTESLTYVAALHEFCGIKNYDIPMKYFACFYFYTTGCPCHLMHIAAERAAKQLPVRVDDLLIDIFYHLEKSSKRKQEFRAFQEKTGVPQHKIIKHVSTRWLSLGQCLARLLEQWDALYPFFRAEKEKPSRQIQNWGHLKRSLLPRGHCLAPRKPLALPQRGHLLQRLVQVVQLN